MPAARRPPEHQRLRSRRRARSPAVRSRGAGRDSARRRQLSAPAGRITALVGPSGCGKSTLLDIVAGLETPVPARYSTESGRWTGAENVSMAFQQPALLPWISVRDNIALGLRSRGTSKPEAYEKIAGLLEVMGLDGFEKAYPHELSGGMAQRVGIARALAVDPSVLLMDEPFASVDAYTRVRLQDELLQVMDRQPTTVVFVTHDVGEAMSLRRPDRGDEPPARSGGPLLRSRAGRPDRSSAITLRRSRRSSISSSSAAELSRPCVHPDSWRGTPMPLAHDSDQSIFADSIERFLSGLPAEETVETLLAGDSPPAPDAVARVWAKFQAALEPIGLPLPDDLGGTRAELARGWARARGHGATPGAPISLRVSDDGRQAAGGHR